MRKPTPHREDMEKALDALKTLFPDQPILCLVAFPTLDPEMTDICSASNLVPEHQREILSVALAGMTHPDTTPH